MPIHNAFDGPPLNQPARSKSLEESDIYLAANKNASRANSVAKIKVVVCLSCLHFVTICGSNGSSLHCGGNKPVIMQPKL